MARNIINLGLKEVEIWPEDQKVEVRRDLAIKMTAFTDIEEYHPRLITKILELEQKHRIRKRYFRGACGTKIHHIDKWDYSGANLINARAVALFTKVLECDEAVVDLSWANLYRKGDYCMPHSHVRSTASVVYFLDTGDKDPDDPLSGCFCIVDPRIGSCCQEQEECVTTPFLPEMTAGTMIIFPSQVVHGVNPYTGDKPRITLSWNINQHAIPGSPLPSET